jgi:uncharacterized protein YuzE
MTVRLGHLEFAHVVYDEQADVLYLSVGAPEEAAYQEVSPDGHLVRYDAHRSVIGITFVNAKWFLDRDGGLDITFHVDADELAPALP